MKDKIPEIRGEFSIHEKRIILTIDENIHDISRLVPENVWRPRHVEGTGYLLNPKINYDIRVELSKIANDYIKKFYPNVDIIL